MVTIAKIIKGMKATGDGSMALWGMQPKCQLAMVMLIMLVSICSIGNASAAGGDILWQRGDVKAGNQQTQATAVDSQGNMVLTGYRNLSGDTNDDYYTVKFKADGSGTAWTAFYDKAGGSDKATAIAVDAANDVIVTGYVWNGTNKDIHTIKYSGADGAVLWQHTWNGSANGIDQGTSVTVDSLNNIYVGGTTQNATGNDDFVIIKYSPSGPNPDGSPLWAAIYNGTSPGNDQLAAVTAGVDGVAATGQSWNGSSYDMLTVKYGFDGHKLWEQRYSSGAGFVCGGKQVKMDAAGNVVVSGSAANSLDLDIHTAKYNGTTGTVVWEKTYNGAFDDEPSGIYVDNGGDVYVTGYTWTLSGTNDFYTARYRASNGDLIWQKNFDSGSGNTDVAVATGIIVDEAGDVFVTGYTVAGGNYDYQTVKYKRDNGNQLWHSSFNGSAGKNDRPAGLGLSPAGDVLVGGWSDSGTDLDFYVIKYDAGALNPPTGLTTNTISNSSVSLSWTINSGNEDGFKVERKLGEQGTYSQIGTVGPGINTYMDSDLLANNYYYYRVRAYNATNGDSHYSNVARALTVFVNFIAPSWSYLFNNPDNLDDFANAIAVGPDNNPVVTGYSLRSVGGFDYYTVKLNHVDKSIIWSHLYDDADSEMDVAKCVAVDAGNNAIVSGYSQLFYQPAQRNINSIYTLKYPPTGPPELWHSQYNGPGAIDDRATAIATTTDASGNIVVIGYGKNAAGNEDIYVVKYAASPSRDDFGNANPSWAAVPFDRGGDDIPSAVAIAPDGSVYVTGYSETAANSNIYNLYTAKYDGNTGAVIWSDVYSVVTGGDNRGNAVAVDAAGDAYVTGSATNVAGNKDIYTIKYSGTGSIVQRLWERPLAGPANGDDDGISVRVDSIDGAIVVAGTTLTTVGDHDITLIRYNAAGDTVWQKTLQRSANDDLAVAMTVDSSGYIYVAGNTSNGTTTDIISLIYDYEGALLGATIYNGAANGNDEASAVTVNYQGEAFIAGSTTNASGNADYVVLKQTNNFILVPAPFTATPQADYSKIDLAWRDNTPGTSFRIERTLGPATSSSTWTLINTATPGTTTAADTGLNGNTQYCYRLEAFNGSLVSRKIISCATTTLQAPVLNPLSLLTATTIDITWNNIPGNSGYRLERMAAAGSWTQIGGNLAIDTVVYHDTLTAGIVYQYRVSTINSAGLSVVSNIQIAPVLNALAGITATKIDLSWPAVSGATGYKIERSTDNSNWTMIATTVAASVSYSDTTVAAGVLYYYRLRATTATGDSAPSLVQSGQTKLQNPAITAATAVTTTEISVTWTDPNSFETGYTLEYSGCLSSYQANCATNTGYDYYWAGWTAVSVGADTTTRNLTGLTPGNLYRLRVKATGAINSDTSPLVTAMPNLIGPSNLVATAATTTSVNLAWSDVYGETGYRVLKDGVVMTGTGLPLAQNTISYTVPGLTVNVPYCFKVQPYNAASSADSNESCVTIYGPPTLNSATAVSQNQIDLGWTDVTGDSGYEVWRSAASYQTTPPISPTSGYWDTYTNLTPTPLATDSFSFSNTSLTAGYTYKYKIRYKLGDGSFSAFSNELMATTIPATPNLSSTVISSSQINVSWYNNTGESSYNLQQKVRIGTDCTTQDWTGITPTVITINSSSTPVTGLLSGTIYCFRLNAANGAGASPWSTAITQTTLLVAPTLNTPAGITQSKIDLSWNNITGNTGYRIERKNDAVAWAQLATPDTDVATYSDTTAAANTTYYYRVSARNSAGVYSATSNEQSGTTLAITPPLLSPLSGITTGQIVLSWNDVAGNVGYKIERSPDGTTWTQIATPLTGTITYINSGLASGTLYYYRVSTKNSSGSYSVPSNVLSATTTPAAPSLSQKLITEARIDLAWQLVYGATNYKISRSIGSTGPWSETNNLAIAYATLYCGYTTPTIGCPTLVPVFTTYADTALTENTEYCYRMTAWNGTGGDSAPSNMVCQKTPAVGAPSLNAVTPLNSGKIKLEWSYTGATCSPVPCDNPDGFQIWRMLPTGEMGLVISVPNTSSYTDILAIEPQKTYTYQVRAYKGGDTSQFSNALQATTPAFTAADGSCQ